MRRLVVAMCLVSALGCDDLGAPVTMAPIITPSPTSTDATFANGAFAGPGHTTSNGCVVFDDAVTAIGTINVNKAGQGTWTKVHVSAGVTFTFNIQLQVLSATSATFTATKSEVFVGGSTFTVTDTGTLADSNVLTVTQEFTRQGTPCKTVYNMTLHRQ